MKKEIKAILVNGSPRITMNCPNEEIYKMVNYNILLENSANQLKTFGDTEIMCSMNTYQFNDYTKYEAERFDINEKERCRELEFPKDIEKAFNIGANLVDKVLNDIDE